MTFHFFHSVGNFILPTDELSIIFQRGRAQPPTSNWGELTLTNINPYNWGEQKDELTLLKRLGEAPR